MEPVNMRHVRTEEQRELYREIQQSKKCSFCEDFCRGQAPTFHKNPILKETSCWVFTEIFPDKYPGATLHFLLVSKTLDTQGCHILFPDLPPQAWQEFGEIVSWAVKEYDMPGGAFFCRFGDTNYTGASISHLHAHLIFGGATQGEALRVKLGYQKK